MVEASYRKEDNFLAGISIKYNEVDWLEALNELSSTGRAVVTDANRNVAANFNNNYQD